MSRTEYFDRGGFADAALRWAIATRAGLDRWERALAVYLRQQMYHDAPVSAGNIWRGRTEHHLTLVAAAHLEKAMGRLAPPVKGVPQVLRAEVRQTRDLLEHWEENQPIFNVHPRPADPRHRSGKKFAESNPGASPYMAWANWNSANGPMLTPHVPAVEVRALIASVERRVVEDRPEMARFVPLVDPNAPELWLKESGIWPHPELLHHPTVAHELSLMLEVDVSSQTPTIQSFRLSDDGEWEPTS